MCTQISVVASSTEHYTHIEQAFQKLSDIEINLTYASYSKALLHPELNSADFTIYNFTAVTHTFCSVVLDNPKCIDNSICIFDEKSSQSELLEKLGFTVFYQPCSPKSLVTHVKQKLQGKPGPTSMNNSDETEKSTLVFSSMDRYVMVEKNQIRYATSSGNYTTLYLDNDKKVTVTKQIGKVAQKLPQRTFFRIHHSHIVNRSYIETILKETQLQVVLLDKTRVPVSRRKRKEFLAWLGL